MSLTPTGNRPGTSPRLTGKREDAVRVLAVASGGGHWVQLMRLRPAWRGCDVAYLTTEASYERQLRKQAERDGLKPPRFYTTVPASRWQKLRLLWQLLIICRVVMKERPTVVISTGAAPGYFAIRIGRMLGARTIWIDSIANAGEMSLAGQKAGKTADFWLTQWDSVSEATLINGRRPEYWGAVL
jgi:UDP-N-acetylglucosamine:LPS N-acetylglucosamine transferase